VCARHGIAAVGGKSVYIYIYAAPLAGRQFKGRIDAGRWCIAAGGGTAAGEGSRREGKGARACERGDEGERKMEREY